MGDEKKSDDGKIPSLHVSAKSIPEAYWKAMDAVHHRGYKLRTKYDRKNPDGSYIDPPGKDAKVTIEVTDPFAQPRFPALSWCKIGKYIAEFLGAKNHLVVPYRELLKRVHAGENEFEATEWPYAYNQRLTAYPRADGSTLDQLEMILDKLARDPITRRAVAITGVPEIDLFMKADAPCLRQIQLRALENQAGQLVLNMDANWRSRDLFKAWGDNVIGITSLQARLAARLAEKTGREVVTGPYTESNGSLHTYGQDYLTRGAGEFFNRFPTAETFVEKAMTSETATEALVLPHLKQLETEETWRFPPKAISLINSLINDFETGKFVA